MVPEASIYKRLFQLDDSKSLHEKMVVSPFPAILKWMFRVPGPSDFLKTISWNLENCPFCLLGNVWWNNLVHSIMILESSIWIHLIGPPFWIHIFFWVSALLLRVHFSEVERNNTLPETNSKFAPEIGHPKKKLHLPTINFQGLLEFQGGYTNRKINMEPKNQPFVQENHLPNLQTVVFHVNFLGWTYIRNPVDLSLVVTPTWTNL